MEYICPRIKRGDPASWQAHFPKTYRGLLNLYGAAQADFAWRVRVATRVKMAFSAIFGTEDLTVSQDAVIVEAQKRARKRPSWLHKDQAPDLPTGYSIQGIYSYWPSAPTDAGTCLVPKSHLTIYDWENEQRELWHKNWLLAPDQSARTSVKPLVPENSLILFDSRLLHANVDAAEPVASNRHGTSGGTSDHGTQRAERREGLSCSREEKPATTGPATRSPRSGRHDGATRLEPDRCRRRNHCPKERRYSETLQIKAKRALQKQRKTTSMRHRYIYIYVYIQTHEKQLVKEHGKSERANTRKRGKKSAT